MSSMTIGIIFIGVVLLIIGVLIYRYITPRLMEGDNGQYYSDDQHGRKEDILPGGTVGDMHFAIGSIEDDAYKRSQRSWDEREL